ncbi:MAG: hypothetical protein HFACDABA_00573 [Anaerolineales bacterium]|nr:hypothetical protein [Anaerolineales bacterium]
MGLVFAALILLAGLMSLMTRMFRERVPSPVSTDSTHPSPDRERGEKARAAAIAVAVALAEQEQVTARPITPPQPIIVGAWQLGMRTRQMTQKGEMKRRG